MFTKPTKLQTRLILAVILAVILATLLPGSSGHAADQDAIAKLLAEANAKGEFSGAVLVEQGGQTIFAGEVGPANRPWKIANSQETKFRICSITKQFTALLVMQLVEAGKLELDKTMSDYLPDLPEAFYVNEDGKMADASFVSKTYLQGDLTFTPGEKFNYNNADFLVLGAIAARVAGQTYETLLTEKILVPLAMKDSGLLKNEDVVDNLASGYTYQDGRYLNEGFVQIQNFGAAGAMYSTVGDLLRWDQALLSHKLLSKKLTDEMFAPIKKLGFVALGSWTYSAKLADGVTRQLTERQGYIDGFCALNVISPEDDLVAIFLSNTETQTLFSTYAGQGLSWRVLHAVFAQ